MLSDMILRLNIVVHKRVLPFITDTLVREGKLVDIMELQQIQIMELRQQVLTMVGNVEQQQKQIKVLHDTNRNLSQRLNRLDKQNRESNHALW